MVSPYCVEHIQFLLAVYASHICPIMLGELNLNGSYASSGSVYQNFFSAQDISFSEKMQSIQSSGGNGCSFLVGHIGRF
tara:strand:- start:32 stop:268 length:237 start_codon:yes stop_codon:yes gene_type:complete